MNGTELAVVESASLALDPEQPYFTDRQVKALEHIGVENAEYGDLEVFHHVCQRTGLDPFARQIYMIGRKSSKQVAGQWVEEWKQTIQTGIDGFRLIGRRAADAAKHKVSVGAPEWAHSDTGWQELWIRSWGLPVAARVTIMRDGEPFTAVALFDEYKQTKRSGELTSMWTQRPAGQLAKCAEALAWRMAFPQDLSGIYVDEEMHQADNTIPGEVVEQRGLGAALAAQDSDPDPGDSPPAEPDVAPLPADQGEPSGSEPVDAEEVETITDAQLRNIGRLLGAKCLNITDRDEQFVKISVILGREVTTRKHLSKEDGMRLIDGLDAELTARAREQ